MILEKQSICQAKPKQEIADQVRQWMAEGFAHFQAGNHSAAGEFLEMILHEQPDNADAGYRLGTMLFLQGRLDEAINRFQLTLDNWPDYAEVHSNLSVALHDVGRLNEAEISCRRAIQIKPEFSEAHNNLGNALRDLGRLEEAVSSYRQALLIKPDHAETHVNLGRTLRDMGSLDESEASYRRALQIRPDYAEAHSNLGITLRELGKLDAAAASFRRALEIKSDFAVAHSHLIFTLDLADTVDMSNLLDERKKWDEAHAASLWQKSAHTNNRDPSRRLRIGYVSADFREHSAAKVFGSMLTRYDRSQFDVIAYSYFNGKNNQFTDLFKYNVTTWRDICNLSDEAVAKMIREDQVDILVDLSGHSTGNRLLVFARKPAPIQITAWGYATGTGMRAMDVFFTDPVMVPPEDKRYFSEEVRYLPSAVSSFFNEPFPDVNELPALASDGIITFGSFNRLVKVTDITLLAWAKVLLAVPRSRLMLKARELNDVLVRERIAGYFIKTGVPADRIIMLGSTSRDEHVHAYHQLDLALDPFPHGGGVTALEGLMMGVPVVTLRWPTMAGRVSASIMTTLGLTDWIAETQEQYIELAIKRAADLQSLTALRRQLRGRFTASVLGDQAAYVRVVEQEYRTLWERWCAG